MEMKLFGEATIGKIQVKNRIFRSATHEGLADPEGRPTPALHRLYERLARGGVGAIFTGYAGVNQEGKSPLKNMLMIHRDDFIPHYREMVDKLHKLETPIILQVAHCGRQTRSVITGLKPVAPSAIRDKIYNEEIPRAMQGDEIERLIHDFVDAICRAKEANFDGVQLHLAHGYMLSQFLSPYTNRRKDEWGGSLENRFRIVRQIFQKAKNRVGDFPIMVKMNSRDGRQGGMGIQEAIQIARWLEEAGCAAIEVSSGTFEDGFMVTRGPTIPSKALLRTHFLFRRVPTLLHPILSPLVPHLLPRTPAPLVNYNLEDAIAIKKEVSIPVITVGGIRTKGDMEKILNQDAIDFIALSRPLIREPALVNRMIAGKSEGSTCTSCNNCSVYQENEPVRCFLNRS